MEVKKFKFSFSYTHVHDSIAQPTVNSNNIYFGGNYSLRHVWLYNMDKFCLLSSDLFLFCIIFFTNTFEFGSSGFQGLPRVYFCNSFFNSSVLMFHGITFNLLK